MRVRSYVLISGRSLHACIESRSRSMQNLSSRWEIPLTHDWASSGRLRVPSRLH
eukprot:COSAG03_NODE_13411_length_504_cov_0.844444_2_plen_53_part_01